MRDPGYFPVPDARDRAHLMTDLIRRIRRTLDEHGRARGRRLLAGGARAPHRGRVPGHGPGRAGMDRRGADRLLRAHGHDVLRLQRGIRGVRCAGACTGQRVHALSRAASLGQPPPAPRKEVMSPSMSRALAHTFYRSGADGVSVFNHFVGHLFTPPYYPQALQVFHDLRDPQRVAAGERHYVFGPHLGRRAVDGHGPHLYRRGQGAAAGARPECRAAAGTYRFRLYERWIGCDAPRWRCAAPTLTERDELAVLLNGVPLADGPLGPGGHAGARTPGRQAESRRAGAAGVPRYALVRAARRGPGPGRERSGDHAGRGRPARSRPVVIDEVEVWVQPC